MIAFRLPRVPSKDVVRALEKAGFIVKRQSDSHVIMRHKDDPSRRCTVPMHGSKTIKPGTLHTILSGARLSVEEFISFLKK